MMRYAAVLFMLALAAPSLGQNAAPDTQAGNFLFSVPTGWNPQEKGDTTYIFAPGQPPGATTFIALAANDMEGDLRNSFNQLWLGFQNAYRLLQGGQIAPLHSRKGYDAF